MKAMLLAFAAVFVIAFGAEYALERIGFSAADTTASDSNVRLGE